MMQHIPPPSGLVRHLVFVACDDIFGFPPHDFLFDVLQSHKKWMLKRTMTTMRVVSFSTVSAIEAAD